MLTRMTGTIECRIIVRNVRSTVSSNQNTRRLLPSMLCCATIRKTIAASWKKMISPSITADAPVSKNPKIAR